MSDTSKLVQYCIQRTVWIVEVGREYWAINYTGQVLDRDRNKHNLTYRIALKAQAYEENIHAIAPIINPTKRHIGKPRPKRWR